MMNEPDGEYSPLSIIYENPDLSNADFLEVNYQP